MAQRLITEKTGRPFDLARGPLVRVTLLRLGDEDYILLLVIHHIVSDGWSMTVLFREISALYVAFSTGSPSPLPELPIQYADFAQWQQQWLQGEVLEKQLSYWKRQLEGSPHTLELPTDHPRPAKWTYRVQANPWCCPRPFLKRSRSWASRRGHSVYDIAGSIQNSAVSLYRSGRHHCWHANRQPQPHGN